MEEQAVSHKSQLPCSNVHIHKALRLSTSKEPRDIAVAASSNRRSRSQSSSNHSRKSNKVVTESRRAGRKQPSRCPPSSCRVSSISYLSFPTQSCPGPVPSCPVPFPILRPVRRSRLPVEAKNKKLEIAECLLSTPKGDDVVRGIKCENAIMPKRGRSIVSMCGVYSVGCGPRLRLATGPRLQFEFLHQPPDMDALLEAEKAGPLLLDEVQDDFERLLRFLWACTRLQRTR